MRCSTRSRRSGPVCWVITLTLLRSGTLTALAHPQGAAPTISDRIEISYGLDIKHSTTGNPLVVPVHETAVSVNGTGGVFAVWMIGTLQDRAYQLGYAFSDDGGTTWTAYESSNGPHWLMPKPPVEDQDCNCNDPDPPASCAADRDVCPPDAPKCSHYDPYVIYHPTRAKFFTGGLVNQPHNCPGNESFTRPFGGFTNTSPTFNVPSTTLLPNESEWTNGEDFPQISGGSSGDPPAFRMYLTSFEVFGNPRLFLRKSDPNNNDAWSARQQIAIGSTIPRGRFPVSAVAPNGTLYVAWTDLSTNATIRLAKSTNSGSSFSWRVDPNNPANNGKVQVRNFPGDPNANYGAKAAGSFFILMTTAISADPTNSNNIYILYHDLASFGGGDQDLNIYLQKSTTGGEFWLQTPTKVCGDSSDVKSDQYMPKLCVDSRGWLHAIWYDTRHSLPLLSSSTFLVDVY
jgi:hypothetical protein